MLLDARERPLTSLRLSVTDRCNLRCAYCMPEEEYAWLPREDILSFEEVERLVDVFLDLGVTRIRFTGGEPLLRRDLPDLVRRVAARARVEDLALTTNGLLLAAQADALAAAGLRRITVSLDTLHRDRFSALTRHDRLDDVIEGLAVAATRFTGTKIDSVVIRSINDDELADLVEFGRRWSAEVRFIENMDVGGATRWAPGDVVSCAEILERLGQRYGPPVPLDVGGSAPARRYALPDGTVFGVISSTTQPFCATCDRSRLTADGMWLLCLYATSGVDLRGALRAGATDAELATRLRDAWTSRTDAGAEQRLAGRDRAVLVSLDELRRNPHLEMHTRGG
jgi:cyclic pyranopterin phosphate synthase